MSTQHIIDHGIINCLTRDFQENQVKTFTIVIQQIEEKFNSFKNLILNSTWIFAADFEKVRNTEFDNIFVISLVDDPHHLNVLGKLEFVNCKFKNIYQIGNIDELIPGKKYFIQYSSVLVKNFFKFYSEEDLRLSQTNFKTYLCYQNKSHHHRLFLTDKFIEYNLLDYGILTLNGSLDIEENRQVQFMGGFSKSREDPYTLGNLSVWNRCFLNIVSETVYDNSSLFFTEKTFKPIIGLRPFLIFGSSKIVRYLKQKGFHIFNEYWNETFHDDMTVNDHVEKICSVVNFLKEKPKQEVLDMYMDMWPKLVYNRNLFFEHAQTENKRLLNIFGECND